MRGWPRRRRTINDRLYNTRLFRRGHLPASSAPFVGTFPSLIRRLRAAPSPKGEGKTRKALRCLRGAAAPSFSFVSAGSASRTGVCGANIPLTLSWPCARIGQAKRRTIRGHTRKSCKLDEMARTPFHRLRYARVIIQKQYTTTAVNNMLSIRSNIPPWPGKRWP